ncbi:MAG TPA: DUF6572 domain-containing protein, partial [Chthoniobacterales bacterium]
CGTLRARIELSILKNESARRKVAAMSCDCEHEHEHEHDHSAVATGVANPAVIDLFALDQKSGEVLLVMNEERAWDGSDERLHELQEKFNAYVSFLLDGEMVATHPELQGKPARIELHCAEMPDERAIALLGMIHEQLELQEIKMEVVVAEAGGCGSGCSCHG